MPQFPYKEAPRIFISYRHEDSAGDAARLFERLAEHFGEAQIFMDEGSIGWGAEFGRVIEVALKSSDILIAIIGHHWLPTIKKKGIGHRRSSTDDIDWVQVEIAAALDQDIHVIPILMHGTKMPKAKDLPTPLKRLTDRNATSLSNADWKVGVAELIQRLDKIIVERSEQRRQWERDADARRQREVQQKKAAAEAEQQKFQAERLKTQRQIEMLKGRLASLAFTALGIGAIYLLTIYFLPDRAKRFVNDRLVPIFALPSPSPRKLGNLNSSRIPTLPTFVQPTPSVARPASSPTPMVNGVGMEFVWIPGEFKKPLFSVPSNENLMAKGSFRPGFFLSKTRVMQEEWQNVTGKSLKPNRLDFKNVADYFCAQVSRKNALDFVRILNSKDDSYSYRLPTKTELEDGCPRIDTPYSSCIKSSPGRDYFDSGFRIVGVPKP